MKDAIFAREVLKRRVCASVVTEICEFGALPLNRIFLFLLFHRYKQLACAGEQDYNATPNPKHLKARGGTRDLYDC
jgi:hypothetical protein